MNEGWLGKTARRGKLRIAPEVGHHLWCCACTLTVWMERRERMMRRRAYDNQVKCGITLLLPQVATLLNPVVANAHVRGRLIVFGGAFGCGGGDCITDRDPTAADASRVTQRHAQSASLPNCGAA